MTENALEEATKLLMWQANEAASIILEALTNGWGDDGWQAEAKESWDDLVAAMKAADAAVKASAVAALSREDPKP